MAYMTAEYTFDETSPSAGRTIVGDVVKANGTTIYVKWRDTGRVEPISRRKPNGVVFKA
jgi:hypothetical protein